MKLSVLRFRQFILFLGDIACFIAGLFVALIIRYGWPIPEEYLAPHQLPFAIIFIIWFLGFYVGGLYNLRIIKQYRAFFTLFFTVFGINAAIAALSFYFVPFFSITPKTVLFLDLLATLILLIGWRWFFSAIAALPPRKLAVIGSGQEVDELLKDFEKHPQQGYRCIFHIKESHGSPNLPRELKSRDIDMVVVAADYRRSPELQKSLFACIPLHIQFVDFVDLYEQYFQKIPLAVIDRAWFLENLNELGKQFFSLVKRGMDIFASVIFGLIGLALTPFIVLAILINSGRPIFYSQTRVGQFEKPFRIYKFRSMRLDGQNESVTTIGGFLRKTHLDEIPQLWNIIRGEMSFVGPRPEQAVIVEQLKIKIPFYTERLLVRPGLTGWAQLYEPRARAEDALEKLQYDLFYVKHRSLLLDLEIILKTLRILIL